MGPVVATVLAALAWPVTVRGAAASPPANNRLKLLRMRRLPVRCWKSPIFSMIIA
ncbi:hypothetical protein GCM10009850_082700 [Nonomuraea monospora]|uniref:Uncharacterized protein n=1 Tax=Nonomuraea monospora TaxID=568818 RepID=A0ABN3CU29_9ACTN